MQDRELLHDFARTASEAAFAVLVERYVGLVYSAALRQVQNPHHAQDITQAVFVVLARKAASLPATTVLSGLAAQDPALCRQCPHPRSGPPRPP